MITICYFSATATELPVLSQAAAALSDRGVRVSARTAAQLADPVRVEGFVAAAVASDAIVVTLHGGTMSCPAWEPLAAAVRQARAAAARTPLVVVHPEGGDDDAMLAARELSDGVDDGRWAAVHRLLARGGPANLEAALGTLAAWCAGEDRVAPEPAAVLLQGIGHPRHGDFATLDGYASHLQPGRPTIGLLFPQVYWLNRNTAHIAALVAALEARGANVIPVFGYRFRDEQLGNAGADELVAAYFTRDGRACIDVLVNVTSMSMTMVDPRLDRVLPDLDVPVLQAMTSITDFGQWAGSPKGLSTLDVATQAAQPEFDGNLITLPVATREQDTVDPLTGALLARLVPIPDRVQRMAELALRWAALRRTPNADKRVAIVFHHHPPRNDRIGCAAGLDTFDSIRLLLEAMSVAGYRVEETYPDADALANALLETMTCDRRWLASDQMLARAQATADAGQVAGWHARLPARVREAMVAEWGPPPGELFCHDGTLGFAGRVNGNVLLTIQPPRGALEKAGQQLHDLALPPPHHYLAHYRWIRDVFGADAVIHVGCHGSLEWLPGKALGLSGECYPDLALADLPNIYPYIINNPGEGTQAKRRSAAALVDHLTPPYRNAGLHDETAQLERALAEYTDAAAQAPEKLPVLAELVWQAAVAADLPEQFGITDAEAMADVDAFLERLHDYLTELADNEISDGLHVLGQPIDDERIIEYLVQLTRLPNGDVPSLREEILRLWGLDLDDLSAHRGEPLARFGGRTGGGCILTAHEYAIDLVRALAGAGYAPAAIPEVVAAALGRPAPAVAAVLAYIATSLQPRLAQVTRESASVLAALSGRFVEPGPSGAPTRGNADILPTGRNFYSVDPRCLPTEGAWQVGVALGDALLDRFQREEGRYPDNVGIIVWGTANMRTRGEDIAEILHLMGLRPAWAANGRVRGLAVVGLAELGRPRIDVTPRISGFFRDAFPNLVELLDTAARMVAGLAESAEHNFLRAHVLADRDAYRADGLGEDEAWRAATLRVFGCPPGTYGAGVEELVEAKAWQTKADLGETYIKYSAHAYGQGLYGDVRPEAFRRQLGRMDATVKNTDTREWDMLSCTDYYNYHGGLIAAAATVRDSQPLSMVGDSSDARRVVTRSVAEETAFVLRSRILNPAWIEGLQRHGYKGAGDLSKVLDILFGWDATAEVMDDWMYARVADRYALDPDMRDWLTTVNPYALANILDKLLEAIRRGMWQASDTMRAQLEAAYLATEGDIEDTLDADARDADTRDTDTRDTDTRDTDTRDAAVPGRSDR
jgi:cobaltochelatase CobN